MSSYKEHQNLIKKFKLLLPQEIPEARFFDRSVGKFLSMRYYQDLVKMVTSIGNFGKYIVHVNKKGMADGYLMIRTKYGVILIETEFKTGKARMSKEQIVWKTFIESNMGGKFILVRCEVEAIKEIKRYLNEKKLL